MQKMRISWLPILAATLCVNQDQALADSSINSSARLSENHKTPSQSRLSVGTYGLSVHTFEEEPIYYKNMPRRIDDKARFVPNQEIMLHYQNKGSQYLVSLAKDCYDMPAFYFSWGRYKDLSRYVDIGFVFGGYFRKVGVLNYENEKKRIKEFYTLDLSPTLQLVPMPLGTLTVTYPITKRLDLGINIGTNIYLTHFITVIKINDI